MKITDIKIRKEAHYCIAGVGYFDKRSAAEEYLRALSTRTGVFSPDRIFSDREYERVKSRVLEANTPKCSTNVTGFAVKQRRDFYVVDLSDSEIAETGFKTRAEAKRWIDHFAARSERVAPKQ
jgi:hypothetical protein